MEKRVSARGIIIDGDNVYLIFRRRIREDEGVKEYYVIPGGGVEQEENLEEAVKRELKEEFSVDVDIIGYLGVDEGNDSIAHFFSCKILRGIPKLGGEELKRCCRENFYEIRKIKITDLDEMDVLAKEMIMKAYNSEFIELQYFFVQR